MSFLWCLISCVTSCRLFLFYGISCHPISCYAPAHVASCNDLQRLVFSCSIHLLLFLCAGDALEVVFVLDVPFEAGAMGLDLLFYARCLHVFDQPASGLSMIILIAEFPKQLSNHQKKTTMAEEHNPRAACQDVDHNESTENLVPVNNGLREGRKDCRFDLSQKRTLRRRKQRVIFQFELQIGAWNVSNESPSNPRGCFCLASGASFGIIHHRSPKDRLLKTG